MYVCMCVCMCVWMCVCVCVCVCVMVYCGSPGHLVSFVAVRIDPKIIVKKIVIYVEFV